jgi:dienelactone hydrolase
MFLQDAARSPWTREANRGFRCALYQDPVPEALLTPVTPSPPRDYGVETPVDDALFATIQRFYAYDARDLNATTDSVDDSPKHWTRERVCYDAAYGNERIVAHLFVPRGGAPPYQAVVYFPGAGSLYFDTIHPFDLAYVEFVIRSGRAVLSPMYKETYERRSAEEVQGDNAWRDVHIQWFKDLARSVDYLESRNDIDHQKLAYFGFSMGAWFGVINTGLEHRFRASVLLAGGLPTGPRPTETDPLNFASRSSGKPWTGWTATWGQWEDAETSRRSPAIEPKSNRYRLEPQVDPQATRSEQSELPFLMVFFYHEDDHRRRRAGGGAQGAAGDPGPDRGLSRRDEAGRRLRRDGAGPPRGADGEAGRPPRRRPDPTRSLPGSNRG